MAMTMVEAAKLETRDLLRSGIIQKFARESDVLRVLPFENIQGNALRYNREEQLPGIAFRGVNEGFTESVGVINPQTESLVIAGGDLDVDRFIIQTMGPGVRSSHETLKVKALAQKWTTTFIKGDSVSQPREFDGLQTRITGENLIANGATSGGDPLSLTKLDEAIDAVSNPTHLLMSRAQRRKFNALMRNQTLAGNVMQGKDDFGRPVMSYAGLPILTTYGDAKNVDPLAYDETGPGGGTTSSSIYVLSFGGNGINGIQNGGMSVRDLGELQTLPLFRTRVEWYAGLAIYDSASAVRLWGISNAAIAA